MATPPSAKARKLRAGRAQIGDRCPNRDEAYISHAAAESAELQRGRRDSDRALRRLSGRRSTSIRCPSCPGFSCHELLVKTPPGDGHTCRTDGRVDSPSSHVAKALVRNDIGPVEVRAQREHELTSQELSRRYLSIYTLFGLCAHLAAQEKGLCQCCRVGISTTWIRVQLHNRRFTC